MIARSNQSGMGSPNETFANSADSPDYEDGERRARPDRRKTPTTPWLAFSWKGRRQRNRRAEEHRRPYFVDRFSAMTFAVVLALLIASIADACLTIRLLQAGANEVNPLMDHFIGRGVQAFLVAKYLLTVSGLPLLLICQNHYLFGTRLRVGYLIPIAVLLYIILIGYQLMLMYGGVVL
jgi:hypothetical protein